MVNLEQHKGSFCVYSSIFCQEVFCSECEIYLKRPSATKNVNRHKILQLQKTPESVLVQWSRKNLMKKVRLFSSESKMVSYSIHLTKV